jgi:hypothetical protein
MQQKIKKNNVSYFHAGFIAGLLFSNVSDGRWTKSFLKELEYNDLFFTKQWRLLMKDYDSENNDTDGLEKMLESFRD